MVLPVARRRVIAELIDELDTIRLARGPILGELVGPLHALLGGEVLWSYRPVLGAHGWDLADVHGSALPLAYVDAFRACIARSTDEFAWYRPTRPERSQQNRIIEAREAVERERPGYFETTPLCRGVFAPFGLDRHHQLRVLLCDGDRLLAWFGIFQRERPHRSQIATMRALVPSLRRRLAAEHRLANATANAGALAAVLDELPRAAFLLDNRGRVELASAHGRALLDRDPSLRQRLAAAALSHAGTSAGPDVSGEPIELVCVRDRASTLGYVATVNAGSVRTARLIDAVAGRWGLTRRQSAVLRLLVHGYGNAEIADELAIGRRAVELHVSAIFERAGVHNRAALVASVLAPD